MTLLLILALLAFVLFAFAMLGPQVDDLRWGEAHHAYWGALLVLAAWPMHLVPLAALGTVLLLDDAWQHAVQRFGDWPAYRSPLHIAYGWVYRRWAWVRRLNAWLDRVL